MLDLVCVVREDQLHRGERGGGTEERRGQWDEKDEKTKSRTDATGTGTRMALSPRA